MNEWRLASLKFQNIRTAGDDEHVDFTGGNVHLVMTEEDWDRKLSEANEHGKIVSTPATLSFQFPLYVSVENVTRGLCSSGDVVLKGDRELHGDMVQPLQGDCPVLLGSIRDAPLDHVPNGGRRRARGESIRQIP